MTTSSPPPTFRETLLLELLAKGLYKGCPFSMVEVNGLREGVLSAEAYGLYGIRKNNKLVLTGTLLEMIDAIPGLREQQIIDDAKAANEPSPAVTPEYIATWEKAWKEKPHAGLVGRVEMSPIEAFHHFRQLGYVIGEVVFGPNRLGQILVRNNEGLHLVRYNYTHTGHRDAPKMVLVARADGQPL